MDKNTQGRKGNCTAPAAAWAGNKEMCECEEPKSVARKREREVHSEAGERDRELEKGRVEMTRDRERGLDESNGQSKKPRTNVTVSHGYPQLRPLR